MGSDPFGGWEGYARHIGYYPYKVVSEKGTISYVTEDEAKACVDGIRLCGFNAKVVEERDK